MPPAKYKGVDPSDLLELPQLLDSFRFVFEQAGPRAHVVELTGPSAGLTRYFAEDMKRLRDIPWGYDYAPDYCPLSDRAVPLSKSYRDIRKLFRSIHPKSGNNLFFGAVEGQVARFWSDLEAAYQKPVHEILKKHSVVLLLDVCAVKTLKGTVNDSESAGIKPDSFIGATRIKFPDGLPSNVYTLINTSTSRWGAPSLGRRAAEDLMNSLYRRDRWVELASGYFRPRVHRATAHPRRLAFYTAKS